jgi:hypothetical protein
LVWKHRRDETEAQFLARCKAEAADSHHTFVYFRMLPGAQQELFNLIKVVRGK